MPLLARQITAPLVIDIRPGAIRDLAQVLAEQLAEALKTTFERDPDLYYEDGYQQLVNDGFTIDVAPIGDVKWVEIDNHDDLAKGRTIACQY